MTEREFTLLYTGFWLVTLAAVLWGANALTMARFDRIDLNLMPAGSQVWEQSA